MPDGIGRYSPQQRSGFLGAEVARVLASVTPDAAPREPAAQVNEVRRREEDLIAPLAREKYACAARDRPLLYLARHGPHAIEERRFHRMHLFSRATDNPGERIHRKPIDRDAVRSLDLGEVLTFVRIATVVARERDARHLRTFDPT